MDPVLTRTMRAGIIKPRRRYSVVHLRLTGLRPLTTATTFSYTPSKGLRLVPEVIDLPLCPLPAPHPPSPDSAASASSSPSSSSSSVLSDDMSISAPASPASVVAAVVGVLAPSPIPTQQQPVQQSHPTEQNRFQHHAPASAFHTQPHAVCDAMADIALPSTSVTAAAASAAVPTVPAPYPAVRISRPLTHEEALRAGPLLPPLAPQHTGKLTLVLDLDETLVHAALAMSEQASSPTPHDFSFHIDDIFGTGQRREVMVWKRPGLSTFLSLASKLAEIVVFTASLKEYAAPLLDIIDPDRVIAARLYRESAVQTECGVVKDLSLLGRDLSRVVIVDNDPVSFLRHPDNAVLIRSFRGTDEDAADASFAVLQRLLEELAPLADVRPALAARFGLRRFFRCITPPEPREPAAADMACCSEI